MANIIRRHTGEEPALRDLSPLRVMEDLLGWDPFRTMSPLIARREGLHETGYVPTFEVKETKDSYVFKADLPGVKDSDLDISISGNTLTVSGKREAEEREEGDTWYAF